MGVEHGRVTVSKQPIAIALAFKDAPPATVDVGGAFSFSVLPVWPKGLNPAGASYVLREGEHRLQAGPLPGSEKEDGSIALTLRAPAEAGEHRLFFVVTSAKQDGHEPAEGTLPFALTTLPHGTSLALWDVPSPVIRNTVRDQGRREMLGLVRARRYGYRDPRRAGQAHGIRCARGNDGARNRDARFHR